ncbi:tail fiber domain-containing protein [Pseudomonas sp. Hg5Tf]|uniref:Tail fiber domain-containing protein n=1 Tax=Pseudomonas sp. Hg7Tf TaxID=3236988 RepID=A0AB39I1W6_9PSED|nr:tail fiber domain-containing protein [Pseudomonas sp. Hg5Tf]MDH2558424.1 tail fiber domain-containing protein [Pseudomonas sp. Hg5Tf]
MPWYREGKVAITAGQTTVTGTGTNFAVNSRVGDAFQGPDGRRYEVTNIASATVLSILPAYQGPTVAAGAYVIEPVHGYPKALTDSFREVNAQWGTTLAGLGAVSTEDVVPLAKGGTDATTAAQARTNLGLGTAATATLQSSGYDSSAGAVLKMGAFGLGAGMLLPPGNNFDGITTTGFYTGNGSTTGRPPQVGAAQSYLQHWQHSNPAYACQEFFQLGTGSIKYARSKFNGVWGSWDLQQYNENINAVMNQEIAGIKTFTGSQLRYRGPTPGLWCEDSTSNIGGIWMVLAGGSFQFQHRLSGFGGSAGVSPLYFNLADKFASFAYSLQSGIDNGLTNGAPNRRWSVVYAGSGVINTSDAREKTEVAALSSGEISAAKLLSKEIGTYRWLKVVEEKGDAARHHVGLTVQRAIEIMTSCGLDPMIYGFICYDKWDAVDEVVQVTRLGRVYVKATDEAPEYTVMEDVEESAASPDTGTFWEFTHEQVTVITEGVEAGDRYSFRTDELNMFIAAGLQANQEALEARLAALEAST